MAVLNQIGQMDHYVQVVEYVETKSALNALVRTPTPIKNIWAALQFVSSTENREDKVYDVNKRNYIIHYDADIIVKDIKNLAIVENGKTYYVTGYDANYGSRNQYILLNCKYDG